jgi:hypothetical protein
VDPHVTKTVYGIYYPETRRIVDALWSERPHGWYEKNYTGRQDPMHRGFLARWRAWVAEAGVALGDGYAHEYPTAGANEAIHALMAQHATHGARRIHVFRGEYEGYTHLAAALGLEVVTHARHARAWHHTLAAQAKAGDRFWLSHPSAIDGNVWPDFAHFVETLPRVAPDLRLIVDLTYVGAVPRLPPIDVTHPMIEALLFSLSKPFGVYYHRIGGLVARAEVPSLRGHHWFKNIFSVILGERLLTAHSARDLPSRYEASQKDAIATAMAAGAIPAAAIASDVVMLAHLPEPAEAPGFEAFARADGLRFCISPAMDRSLNP